MAELFVELFSEEIPSSLHIDAINNIKKILEEELEKKEIDLMIRNIDTEIYEKYIKRNYGIQ